MNDGIRVIQIRSYQRPHNCMHAHITIAPELFCVVLVVVVVVVFIVGVATNIVLFILLLLHAVCVCFHS